MDRKKERKKIKIELPFNNSSSIFPHVLLINKRIIFYFFICFRLDMEPIKKKKSNTTDDDAYLKFVSLKIYRQNERNEDKYRNDKRNEKFARACFLNTRKEKNILSSF